MLTIASNNNHDGENDMSGSLQRRGRALGGLLAVALAWAGAGVADSHDPPLSKTINDTGLAWGPCPPVFPAGCEIAVLHGDPANPNADVFFKVPANYAIPHHWHTSAERMVLVSGELHVTYDAHDTANRPEGDCRI